jgi:hypothetical protein
MGYDKYTDWYIGTSSVNPKPTQQTKPQLNRFT